MQTTITKRSTTHRKYQIFNKQNSRMASQITSYVLRNIGRKKKQTFFTVLCIALSSLIIFGNMALTNSIHSRLKEGINQAISGQLTVYSSKDSQLNIMEAQLNEQIPFRWSKNDGEDLYHAIPGLSTNRRIRFGSLISFGEETSFVQVQALEADHLERISRLITISQGVLPGQEGGILISETIADKLQCHLGDTLLLIADNINEYMSDEVATVRGIFSESGLAFFFGYTAFMPYASGQEIVQLPDDECLELIINSETGADLSDKETAEIIRHLHSGSEPVRIASWEQTIPLFYTLAGIWRNCGYLTQILFISFSLMILVNLTTLIVNSRRKEFGSLLALGFSWRKITLMTCAEYLIIGFSAIFVSALLTYTLNALLPPAGFHIPSAEMQQALMTETIRPFLYFNDLLYVLLLFGLTITAAVLISISRIRKINPVFLINSQ